MAENKMAQVAALLGVGLCEVFEIEGKGEWYLDIDGCKNARGTRIERSVRLLIALLTGEETIIKKPWKPKEGEKYYSVDDDGDIAFDYWYNDSNDFCYALVGNVFRTEEEAEAHVDEVMEKFKEWRG